MPIWLRRFTHNKMNEYYEKEKEDYEKQLNKNQITEKTQASEIKSLPKVNMPSYVSSVKKGK